nr:MAG TPA: hypothetical protein [Caudoviricetes sp.]
MLQKSLVAVAKNATAPLKKLRRQKNDCSRID